MTAEQVKEIYDSTKSTQEFINELCGAKGKPTNIAEVADAITDHLSYTDLAQYTVELFLESGKLIDENKELNNKVIMYQELLLEKNDKIIELLNEKLALLKSGL